MTTPVTQQSFDDFAARMDATLGGLGTRMDRVELSLDQVRAEVAIGRVDHLELRAGMAELRLRAAEYEQAAQARFETLTDSMADLRNEYRGHTHE